MNLEIFGSLIKEEKLKSYERGIIPNTLVLENRGLFPGYYGAGLFDSELPDSLFLVTVNKESTEKILRVTQNIKNQTGIKFKGAAASICINNSIYSAIRIRGLSEVGHVGELQEFYRDAGIEFMKSKSIDSEGVIKIKKIFRIEAISSSVFYSKENSMHYIKIDRQLTWSQFRMITKEVRNNVSLPAFDVALGIFYAFDIHDVIRVYCQKMNENDLKELHNKYNEIIERRLK